VRLLDNDKRFAIREGFHMKGKKAVRVVLDVLLTVLIVVEMFIQYTGVLLHEVIGFAFFATVIVHLALSAKWIKSTAGNAREGKLTKRRTALAVIGMLLAVTVVILAVSSVAISNLLVQAGFTWTIGSYALWATVHAVSAYALCALVVVHLGMHWVFLASAFRIPYDPSRRRAIGTSMHAVAAVGAVALGVMAASKAVPYAGTAQAIGEQGSANSGASGSDAEAGGTAQGGSTGTGGTAQDGSTGTGGNAQGGSTGNEMSQDSGRKKRKSDRSNGSESGNNQQSTPSQGSGTQQNAPSQGSGTQESTPSQGSGSSDSAGGSSGVTGICTLCRKQCPLSAPKCNKPYQEGLL